mmetsp:Transcript_3770/g.9505  ORF Transcript_3770/g.9505 Transcript_3770/m.9505 type:complete len:212 (+) Transcript_3770:2251-2886(+)
MCFDLTKSSRRSSRTRIISHTTPLLGMAAPSGAGTFSTASIPTPAPDGSFGFSASDASGLRSMSMSLCASSGEGSPAALALAGVAGTSGVRERRSRVLVGAASPCAGFSVLEALTRSLRALCTYTACTCSGRSSARGLRSAEITSACCPSSRKCANSPASHAAAYSTSADEASRLLWANISSSERISTMHLTPKGLTILTRMMTSISCCLN